MQERKEDNIQKHNLIPKHLKLNEEEKQKLLEKFNISFSQLPSIHQNDPGIKDLDTNPGDVIKILRTSQTSSEAIFYRVVVHG